ncbi:MAG: deoxynucleoside kinase [Bryobacterales bacterium]
MSAARYVAIEGPLRVGKSSLARALAERIHARTLLDTEENPFLEEFYKGGPGAGFRTQMWFLMERYQQLSEAGIEHSQTPVVADYLFEKDKLFAYLNLTDEEVSVYDLYYNHFKESLVSPDLVIYLKATPEVLRERISRKGLPGGGEDLQRLSARDGARLRALFRALQVVGRAGGRYDQGRFRAQ